MERRVKYRDIYGPVRRLYAHVLQKQGLETRPALIHGFLICHS